MKWLWERLLALFGVEVQQIKEPAHPVRAASRARREPGESTRRPSAQGGAQPSAPARGPAPPPGEEAEKSQPPPARPGQRLANLDDHEELKVQLVDRQENLLLKVERRIDAGRFDLPQLPANSLVLMNMANDPGVEVAQLVQVVATDPVLSGELLKLANSALYAAPNPAKTIREAVMRLGLRALRSMVLSVSMHGTVLRARGIQHYAEEVWRQAYSVASLNRLVAARVGLDPEEAFLLGLVHDIGKISLLSMIAPEMRRSPKLASGLIGRLFHRFHERAGAAMAEAWGLSEEIVSVAGCHHDFRANPTHPLEAAAVSLAHKMDLFLSMGADREYRALREHEAALFLSLTPDDANELLAEGERLFRRMHGVKDEAEAAA